MRRDDLARVCLAFAVKFATEKPPVASAVLAEPSHGRVAIAGSSAMSSSSVSLVLVNKYVFAGGFRFPMTLTFFHFVFTVGFYRLLAALKMYEPAYTMPAGETFKMAAAGVGSIGFMNISLQLNSVGFYQITKLAIVPCTLVAQALLFNSHASRKVKVSLAILLLGVGLATVTDVQLNAPGFVLGVLAILTTTIFQIWQGSKQKDYDLSATQLQGAVCFFQALQSCAAAIALENLCIQLPGGGSFGGDERSGECRTAVSFLMDYERNSTVLGLVFATCFIALAVNWCSFGLIGRTSAITFQVVGHTKTCLVLTGGFLLWPLASRQQLINNVIGVSVAMVGCVLYGHIKLAEQGKTPDLFDRACPTACLRCIEPHKYARVPQEMEDGATPEGIASPRTESVAGGPSPGLRRGAHT